MGMVGKPSNFLRETGMGTTCIFGLSAQFSQSIERVSPAASTIFFREVSLEVAIGSNSLVVEQEG